MALIITGHFRSGTTILKKLCQAHPAIDLTNESAVFYYVNNDFPQYCKHLFYFWRRTKNYRTKNYPNPYRRIRIRVHDLLFLTRFLFWIYQYQEDRVQVSTIQAALKKIYPQAQIVGDKFPDYSRILEMLSQQEDLKIVVIYRDPRDVTSSALQMVSTNWKDMWWVGYYDSAEKIAASWVSFINIMENCKGSIHKIRYEAFASNPAQTMDRLGRWLGVDPQFFPTDWVNSTSVGKYQTSLAAADLEDVLRVAGPTMAQLGYE